jgi:Transmembrane protein 43
MSDYPSTNWWDRIRQSLGLVTVGGALFLAAFPILFYNESGAVSMANSLEEGAKQVVSVKADSVDPGNNEKLIHVTAEAIPTGEITDPDFKVSAKAISLTRTVEIYQWKEKIPEKKTDKKKDETKKEDPKPKYKQVWSTDVPVPSKSFKEPFGHFQVGGKPFDNQSFPAKEVTLGAFKLSDSLVNKISGTESLAFTDDMKKKLPKELGDRALVLKSGMLYLKTTAEPDKDKPAPDSIDTEDPEAAPAADEPKPQIGDMRIAFRVVKPQTVSVVARQIGDTFAPFMPKAGREINMLSTGDKPADQMFTEAKQANEAMTWFLRVAGFVVMAFGIYLVFRPLSAVASGIPYVGAFLDAGLWIFALVIAALLSVATIGISWVVVRPVIGLSMLGGSLVLLLGVVMLFRRRRSPA